MIIIISPLFAKKKTGKQTYVFYLFENDSNKIICLDNLLIINKTFTTDNILSILFFRLTLPYSLIYAVQY